MIQFIETFHAVVATIILQFLFFGYSCLLVKLKKGKVMMKKSIHARLNSLGYAYQLCLLGLLGRNEPNVGVNQCHQHQKKLSLKKKLG